MGKIHNKNIKYIIALLLTLAVAVIIISSSNTVQKVVYPLKYKEQVYKYSNESKIDPYLVFAIIKAESSFDPKAISKKSAKGLMQLTDGTASWGASKLKIKKFVIDDLYNPDINIRIGCWYISSLMHEFGNNVDLVITAYNGGSGNVNTWLKDKNLSSSGDALEKIPFKETERFLKRVKNYLEIYEKLYEKV